MAGVLQANLQKAKEQRRDEFYTQLADIENELRHYRDQFRGKVVFCNCDDPFESNFFKYFANNFNFIGLKKLITTSYSGSPIWSEPTFPDQWQSQLAPAFDLPGQSASCTTTTSASPSPTTRLRCPLPVVSSSSTALPGP